MNLVEVHRAVRLERRLVRFVAGARQAVGRQRELNLAVVELLRVRALAGASGDRLRAHDLDTRLPRAVTTCHLGVHLLNGARQVRVTVLLVHVVRAGTRVVAQPNAPVLDRVRVLLKDLVNGNDLTVRLLHTLQLRQEVLRPTLDYCAW